MNLTINSKLVRPAKELSWRFSRATGPGGQAINKTPSRVELIFDLASSNVLDIYYKKRLMRNLKGHLINGCLHIIVSKERSQYKNRQLALIYLSDLLREGLRAPQKKGNQQSQLFHLRSVEFR